MALALMTAHLAFASGESPLVDAGGIFMKSETTTTGTWTTGTWTTGTWTTGTTTGTTTGGTTVTTTGTTTTGGGPETTTTGSSTSDDGTIGLLVDVDGAGFVLYDQSAESGDDHTVVFASQTIDDICVRRQFYVPFDGTFSRWISAFTNVGDTTRTVTALVAAVLIYGENSVSATSSGDTSADVNDTWVVALESGSGNAIGFVLQGSGASVPVSFITFLNDENNLSEWEYTFDLAPGETVILMNFATNTTDPDTAASVAASLANLEGCALDRLSDEQLSQIVNFSIDTGGGGGGGLSCLGGISAATPPSAGGDLTLLTLLTLFLVAIYIKSFRRISPSA